MMGMGLHNAVIPAGRKPGSIISPFLWRIPLALGERRRSRKTSAPSPAALASLGLALSRVHAGEGVADETDAGVRAEMPTVLCRRRITAAGGMTGPGFPRSPFWGGNRGHRQYDRHSADRADGLSAGATSNWRPT